MLDRESFILDEDEVKFNETQRAFIIVHCNMTSALKELAISLKKTLEGTTNSIEQFGKAS